MGVAITTTNLSKVYRVREKEPGLAASLRSLIRPKKKIVKAVTNVNIRIDEGELVGFIGPNGAGKTTTLKMLAGLLYPSSGTAQVLGYTPWKRKKTYLKQLALVMGQKAQLWWDLPLYDALLVQRDIYEMTPSDFAASLAELTELLELTSFLKVPVRKLSLGQRMRGELAAAFLYRPRVLFLDEPTIGLDVVVQTNIREFLKQYQTRHGATIILTSHYLDDVRELCRRLIVIDRGAVVFDGSTDDLIKKYVDHKQVVLTFSRPVEPSALVEFGRVTAAEPIRASLQVPRGDTSSRVAAMLAKLPIEDISIVEPSLKDVVRELFSGRDYA